MRRRSQGIAPPPTLLEAHLHRLQDDRNFPNVATPVLAVRRILQHNPIGTASDNRFLALADDESKEDTDDTTIPPQANAAMLPAGGHTAPTLADGSAATRPAGGRPVPVDVAVTTAVAETTAAAFDELGEDNPYFNFGMPAPLNETRPPASPTALGTFAMAVGELPDLAEPVDSFLWRETFMRQARLADIALAEFRRELDGRFDSADAIRVSCAALKDSCMELRDTATKTTSDLASLIALMGRTHERVSTLEAASAKNTADVAATNELVGRHIGALKSDVSVLGQDVHALRTLLATMHGKPPPPDTPPPTATAANGTPRVNFASEVEVPTPPAPDEVPTPPAPVVTDGPSPAVDGSTPATNRLFPNVDMSNLRVDPSQRERFHAADWRSGHDDDAPTQEGDRWAPGWQQSWRQRAPPTIRPVPVNPYLPSRPRAHDSRSQLLSDNETTSLGGSITSPRHADRRRQAANARVSPFDIAALANTKYHGGNDGYYTLTPSIIHNCGYTAINTGDVISSYNEIILVHEAARP